ncbi:hypothetical protein DNK06_07800 [Pseudomonas daroniae]|uniref:Uncharacterized protein n=1 Tax=Phytopseudomonas daroniae TaxID=2487519 RepID=A0A4Q9QQ84_9GAMM|nr:hypothetical protein DNK06_07800 [Pseudomonas daroniae]TBU84167.1 hypothetical protein DNK31_07375 [Pseudomonas sp. FRB 228]
MGLRLYAVWMATECRDAGPPGLKDLHWRDDEISIASKVAAWRLSMICCASPEGFHERPQQGADIRFGGLHDVDTVLTFTSQ